MDLPPLRSALAAYFSRQGFQILDEATGLDLLLAKDALRLGLALCPQREEEWAFLGAFEAAMQRVIDKNRAQTAGLTLALGIDFASTAAGQSLSYRRALKKYSNSIIFEDLGLSLYLAIGDEEIIALAPAQVNPFLRNLDRWIAEQKKQLPPG